MSHQLSIKALGIEQIDQAFPILQVAAPTVTLEQWRAFTQVLLAREPSGTGRFPPLSGVIAAQSASGHIRGLFCYAMQPDILDGQVLAVGQFVVADLVDVCQVVDTLIAAMDYIAEALGCTATRVDLHYYAANTAKFREALLARLWSAGHEIEGVCLRHQRSTTTPKQPHYRN